MNYTLSIPVLVLTADKRYSSLRQSFNISSEKLSEGGILAFLEERIHDGDFPAVLAKETWDRYVQRQSFARRVHASRLDPYENPLGLPLQDRYSLSVGLIAPDGTVVEEDVTIVCKGTAEDLVAIAGKCRMGWFGKVWWFIKNRIF